MSYFKKHASPKKLTPLLKESLVLFFVLMGFSFSVQGTENVKCSKLAGGESKKATQTTSAKPKELLEELVKFDKNTYEFQGLTKEGQKALKKGRDTLRERVTLFDGEILNMGSIHHAGTVARMWEGHMFLYGGPGGAKSMFAKWMIAGEVEKAFEIQLNQMTPDQAITGGQDFEAAKRGEYILNPKTGLARHKVGLVDEIHNGSPVVMTPLLGITNEREVQAGGQVIKADTETVFATSNANLPEIFEQFRENGMGATAPALFNRFQFKGFVYNWLPLEDQALLGARNKKKRYLKALAKMSPEVMKDEVFLKPQPMNWEKLRVLAYSLFTTTELFDASYLEFADKIRELTNKEVQESEERFLKNRATESFVYTPSVDLSDRLREQIPEIILMSAFLDFLMSPLADDANLAAATQKQFALDPISLWRGYLAMTTLGGGETKLKWNPEAENKMELDFGFKISEAKAKDRREMLLIRNLQDEQSRFKTVYENTIKKLQEQFEIRASNALDSAETFENNSFEMLLLQSKDD